MSTQYILAATGGDYSAYPLRKADFTDWADDAVDLVEEGSTGKYASSSLHRGFGDQWAVFNKTVASGAPSAWTDAVDKIDLGDAGGWLNVCRDTPYGIQTPNAGNIANAVNWALKYQGVEDPANRSPAGGPNGCFTPYIPKCDNNKYWYSTGQWFVPNRKGVHLFGGGHHRGSGLAGGITTAGEARVRFNLADNTKPAIVNQGSSFVIQDIGFYTINDTAIGMLNHRITSMGDAYYVADNSEGFGTGSSNTQPVSQLLMTRCGFAGFGIGIQNGGTTSVSNCDHHTLDSVAFDTCDIGWKNVNDQGVNLKFRDISWRGSNAIMFDFQRGGHAMIEHITSTASNATVLNIGEAVGVNNGFFHLRDVKTDTEATDGAYIVYMDTETDFDRRIRVIIDGGLNTRRVNSGTDDAKNKFVRMVGRSSLIVNGLSYPGIIECYGGDPGGAYPGSRFAPSIVLNDCQIGSESDAFDPWRLIDGEVNRFRVNGCELTIGWDGSPPKTMPTPITDRTYTTIFTG